MPNIRIHHNRSGGTRSLGFASLTTNLQNPNRPYSSAFTSATIPATGIPYFA
jgi:hypothetical protein